MAFKFLFFFAVVAVASAGLIPAQINSVPQYSYAYDVQDPLTGDSKSQQETRSGDIVQGQYSLIDSDGTRRTVDYAADAINGFNAVVRKDPLIHTAPVIAAAPAISLVQPSIISSSPALSIARAAPLAIASPLSRSISVSGPIASSLPLSLASPIGASIASPLGARLALPISSGLVSPLGASLSAPLGVSLIQPGLSSLALSNARIAQLGW